MDSETKLSASVDQVDELIKSLQATKAKVMEHGTTEYSRVTLEQFAANGPWRLVIAVFNPEDN